MFGEFAELKHSIQSAYPDLEVLGNVVPPRMKAFEVSTDSGIVLFSKLANRRFPTSQEVLDAIAALSTTADSCQNPAPTSTAAPSADSTKLNPSWAWLGAGIVVTAGLFATWLLSNARERERAVRKTD